MYIVKKQVLFWATAYIVPAETVYIWKQASIEGY